MVATGMLFASWSVLAIELTLRWNSVKGIYNIQSTGQIIPLVVGLGILVKVLWLLRHGNVSGAALTCALVKLTLGLGGAMSDISVLHSQMCTSFADAFNNRSWRVIWGPLYFSTLFLIIRITISTLHALGNKLLRSMLIHFVMLI